MYAIQEAIRFCETEPEKGLPFRFFVSALRRSKGTVDRYPLIAAQGVAPLGTAVKLLVSYMVTPSQYALSGLYL